MKAICFITLVIVLPFQTLSQLALADEVDPHITIINVEEGDRAFIAEIIRKVESCGPRVIAIDLWFTTAKDRFEDPPLEAALRIAQNDILGYTYLNNEFVGSHRKFTVHAKDQGLALVQLTNEVVSYFTPVLQIRGEPHEHIALKIVKHWDPDFPTRFEVNERVRIRYQRGLEQINHIQGSALNTLIHKRLLQNKIVLLGYIGPSDEDKHYTPLREVLDLEDEGPDTYGVVIIANEIRTLLDRIK